jgi:sulfatase maturation enzyme AslB (radical SAM superfamily)
MVNITSNGVSYDDPRVNRFLAKNDGRVSIGITIDGDEETHDACRRDCNGCGSYHKAAAAFKDAREKYDQKGTKFTIAPGNVDRTFTACTDIIERFDLESLFCNCVYEEGWEPKHARTLYYELKKFADWLIATNRHKYMYLSIFSDEIGGAHSMLDD